MYACVITVMHLGLQMERVIVKFQAEQLLQISFAVCQCKNQFHIPRFSDAMGLVFPS